MKAASPGVIRVGAATARSAKPVSAARLVGLGWVPSVRKGRSRPRRGSRHTPAWEPFRLRPTSSSGVALNVRPGSGPGDGVFLSKVRYLPPRRWSPRLGPGARSGPRGTDDPRRLRNPRLRPVARRGRFVAPNRACRMAESATRTPASLPRSTSPREPRSAAPQGDVRPEPAVNAHHPACTAPDSTVNFRGAATFTRRAPRLTRRAPAAGRTPALSVRCSLSVRRRAVEKTVRQELAAGTAASLLPHRPGRTRRGNRGGPESRPGAVRARYQDPAAKFTFSRRGAAPANKFARRAEPRRYFFSG